METNLTVLDRQALPFDGTTYAFEGFHYPKTEVSFLWVDMPPGGRVRLHKHPYQEVFIVQEGSALFTVGSSEIRAQAGQIILAPADIPHKFVNIGDTILKQIDIHTSRQFITTWLEE
jgi:mannose-6-phosphate isomerase-like protein (cupin superfamily)